MKNNTLRIQSISILASIAISFGFTAASAWGASVCPINVNYDENYQLAIHFAPDQSKLATDGSPVIADDGNGNKVIFIFDKEKNLVKFKNECDSKQSVTINVFGSEFTVAPCEEKKLYLAQHKPEASEGNNADLNQPAESAAFVAPTVEKHQVVVDMGMDGTLMAYIFGGKAFTINSGLSEVALGDGNFVHFNYMDMKDLLIIKNTCDSKVDILVKVFDSEIVLKPCQEEKVLLATAEGNLGLPQNEFEPDTIENIQEGREPISPFQA